MSYSCCNTDLCNAKDAPDPSSSTAKEVPNGKKCYECYGPYCSDIVNCTGSEDHCITHKGTYGGLSFNVKGCASKDACDSLTSSLYGQGVSCCSGNLCNGVQSVTQSFLFLCCSLLSFILLH
ncbi:hypothetical protein G5714_020926 [Onychostoma macrolepis]|uniref:UPAR/Ly6 domain-containing protein n=2 Tax=Onychostoma macrolepis TaxID=369639 RepID=A0A7J6BV74_9TELE|nr:hypothetical protein G5714_020926 [Onychostoma macrolepis]